MAENKVATEASNAWVVPSQALNLTNTNSATGEKITLQTAGKFLDRNIEVEAPTADVNSGSISSNNSAINSVSVGSKSGTTYPVTGSATIPAPTVNTAGFVSETVGTKIAGTASVDATIAAGELTATVTNNTAGSASVTPSGFTASTSETGYAVKLSTSSGSVKAKADVKTNGYVSVGNETSTTSATEVKVNGATTLYIPEAGVSATASEVTPAQVDLSMVTDSTTVKTSTSATSYKVTVKGTSTNGQAKAAAAGTKVGMVSTSTTDDDTVATTVNAIDNEVVYIQAGSIGNAKKDDTLTGYTENTSVIVPSEGYLTISEGYYPNTKISLDQLIEGNPDVDTAIAADNLLQGSVAYNVDGLKITGTIPTVTASISNTDGQTVVVPAGYIATAQNVTVDNGSVKLDSETKTGNFDINPSLSDQKVTISEGWIEDKTITIKAATVDNLGQAVSSVTTSGVSASISSVTAGTGDLTAGTVPITGSSNIIGTATAKTKTAGYTNVNDITGTTDITGTASVNATLPLFTGAYVLG